VRLQLDYWRARISAGSQQRAFLFDYYVSGPGLGAAYREAPAPSTPLSPIPASTFD
jgi:hypothetical protein